MKKWLVCLAVAILAFGDTAWAREDQIGARGFSPEKAFQLGEVDNVNLFNGALTATIPIGQQYPVSEALSYGFTVVHSSLAWDLEEDVVDLGGANYLDVTRPFPSHLWNVGMGWSLSLGLLYPPQDPTPNPTLGPTADNPNDSDLWLYVSPDSAKHYLYDSLHDNDVDDGSNDTSYTRDNTYLRIIHDANASTRTVEFPDGQKHVFKQSPGLHWRPTRFEDTSGNHVDIAYTDGGSASTWQITDMHGRSHTFQFAQEEGLARHQLQSADLAAFGGGRALYSFSYQDESLTQCYRHTDPTIDPKPSMDVALLTQITQPDGSTWTMLDGGNPAYGTDCETPGGLPGALNHLVVPTAGAIDWTYGTWRVPADNQPRFVGVSGVVVKALTDVDGSPLGVWKYRNELFPPQPYCDPPQPGCPQFPTETRTVVAAPDDAFCTIHYFDADPIAGFANGWSMGLPFSRQNALEDLFLSKETYEAVGSTTVPPFEVPDEMSRSVSSWDTVPVGDNQGIGIRAEKGDRPWSMLALMFTRSTARFAGYRKRGK